MSTAKEGGNAASDGMLRSWGSIPPGSIDPPQDSLDAEVRCVLALGGALLTYGLPAHRVGEAVHRLARAFGRTSSVFTLPTFLAVTLHHAGRAESHSVHAYPSTVNLARLDVLHRLVARVEAGELTADEAEHLVQVAVNRPHRYARLVELLAVTLVTFGGTLALGGTTADAAVGVLLGSMVGGLLWIAAVWPALGRVLPVLGAVLVTASASLLARAELLAHPLVTALSALFVFVPGLSLTQSMTELATGHLVSGTARMVGALTVFLQLALGMLFGARLTGLSHIASGAAGPPSSLAMAAAGAAVLALGFAVLFQVRYQDALPTLGVSTVAFGVGRLTGALLGPEIGALLASIAVGVYSHGYARRYDRPSSILSLPGMAMLVPGSLGMLSISAAMLRDPMRSFELAFEMTMVMLALSTGVLLSAAAFPPRTDL